jgi:hypothetical protein
MHRRDLIAAALQPHHGDFSIVGTGARAIAAVEHEPQPLTVPPA